MENNQFNTVDGFQSLIKKINQKAQGLDKIALELELLHSEDEIESRAINSLELCKKTLLEYAAELISIANQIYRLPLNRG